MIKVNQILKSLDQKFPEKNAEVWDKVGLQYGNSKQVVNKILISLDLTTSVFDEAIKNQIDLIIVHHPFLFENTKEEDFEKAPYKRILDTRIQNNNIAIYSCHTNFDNSIDGTGTAVAKSLGYKDYHHIKEVPYAIVINEKQTIDSITKRLKETFEMNTFLSNTNDNNKVIEQIAILPGSGSITDIIKLGHMGYKHIMTSDIKWSDWITAREEKINLIEISHSVETTFCNVLKNTIKKKFKDVKIIISKSSEIGKIIP